MDVTLNMVALISLCVFFTVNQEANYFGVPVRVSAGCEQARQTGGESLHLRSLSLIKNPPRFSLIMCPLQIVYYYQSWPDTKPWQDFFEA